MIRTPIPAAVYHAIVRETPGLGVFSSYSDPDGTAFGGGGSNGTMYTLWGLKGADFPLLEALSTWRIEYKVKCGEFVACREGEEHLYWLLSAEQKDVDEDGKLVWTSMM